MLTILQKFPTEALIEMTDSKESEISLELLDNLFVADLSSKGSNKRAAEGDILYNWSNFLVRVHNGKVLSQTSISLDDDTFTEVTLNLKDVLMFMTGSYHLTVLENGNKPSIDFDHTAQVGARVRANTCGPVLTFPVSPRYSCSLDTFCNSLAEDIVGSPGFGLLINQRVTFILYLNNQYQPFELQI